MVTSAGKLSVIRTLGEYGLEGSGGRMERAGMGKAGPVVRRLTAAWLVEKLEGCTDDDVRSLTFFVEADRIWSRYMGWCRDERLPGLMPLELGEVAKEVFPELKWRRVDGVKCWCNVRWR